MKEIKECNELYKDLYWDCLEEGAFDKRPCENSAIARYNMFCDTLRFIYGEKEFNRVEPTWSRDAGNEFYKAVAAALKQSIRP